jgi:hypothetical protein
MKTLCILMLGFVIGLCLSYGLCDRTKDKPGVLLQGVGCDVWFIYPVSLQVLDDEVGLWI